MIKQHARVCACASQMLVRSSRLSKLACRFPLACVYWWALGAALQLSELARTRARGNWRRRRGLDRFARIDTDTAAANSEPVVALKPAAMSAALT